MQLEALIAAYQGQAARGPSYERDPSIPLRILAHEDAPPALVAELVGSADTSIARTAKQHLAIRGELAGDGRVEALEALMAYGPLVKDLPELEALLPFAAVPPSALPRKRLSRAAMAVGLPMAPPEFGLGIARHMLAMQDEVGLAEWLPAGSPMIAKLAAHPNPEVRLRVKLRADAARPWNGEALPDDERAVLARTLKQTHLLPPPSVLQRLAPSDRVSLASNRYAPPQLLRILATDSSAAMHRAIAGNRHAGKCADVMHASPHPEARRALVDKVSDPGMLDLFVDDTDVIVRTRVALNPATSAHSLARLAEELPAVVLLNPSTEVALADRLSEGLPYSSQAIAPLAVVDRRLDEGRYLRAVAAKANLGIGGLLRLIELAPATRAAVAARVTTPRRLLEVLACAKDGRTAAALAGNHGAPPELLDGLDHLAYDVALGLVRNPRTGAAKLAKIWASLSAAKIAPKAPSLPPATGHEGPGLELPAALASHPTTPSPVLEALSDSKHARIRMLVAHHPNTPDAVRAALSRDDVCKVRRAAAAKPFAVVDKGVVGVAPPLPPPPDRVVPAAQVARILANPFSRVRLFALLHPAAKTADLDRALDSVSWVERYAVAQHRNASERALTLLARDGVAAVRAAARGPRDSFVKGPPTPQSLQACGLRPSAAPQSASNTPETAASPPASSSGSRGKTGRATTEFRAALQAACKTATWPSESDFPIRPFELECGHEVFAAELLRQTGHLVESGPNAYAAGDGAMAPVRAALDRHCASWTEYRLVHDEHGFEVPLWVGETAGGDFVGLLPNCPVDPSNHHPERNAYRVEPTAPRRDGAAVLERVQSEVAATRLCPVPLRQARPSDTPAWVGVAAGAREGVIDALLLGGRLVQLRDFGFFADVVEDLGNDEEALEYYRPVLTVAKLLEGEPAARELIFGWSGNYAIFIVARADARTLVGVQSRVSWT